jgi:hypothetical protein
VAVPALDVVEDPQPARVSASATQTDATVQRPLVIDFRTLA